MIRNLPQAPDTGLVRCVHHHELTPENTYHRPDGYVSCRLCNRQAQRKLRGWDMFGLSPSVLRSMSNRIVIDLDEERARGNRVILRNGNPVVVKDDRQSPR
jgi:hypothetical protein